MSQRRTWFRPTGPGSHSFHFSTALAGCLRLRPLPSAPPLEVAATGVANATHAPGLPPIEAPTAPPLEVAAAGVANAVHAPGLPPLEVPSAPPARGCRGRRRSRRAPHLGAHRSRVPARLRSRPQPTSLTPRSHLAALRSRAARLRSRPQPASTTLRSHPGTLRTSDRWPVSWPTPPTPFRFSRMAVRRHRA